MRDTVKGRRVRKPPYVQYAVICSIVLWAIVVTVLLGVFAHRCKVLTNESISIQHKLDEVQEECVQLRNMVRSYRDLLIEQDATDGDGDTAPVYVFLSTEERDLVERVVMSECGNQPLEGVIAVAQCIYNTAMHKGISAGEVVTAPNQYADPYGGEVNAKVKEAISAVFDRGETAVDEPIMYFYAYKRKYSEWHETSPSLEFVCIIEDHKFFKLAGT